jgi:hypothetical protein
VTVRGEGITQVTLGSLEFVRIPAGRTATLRIENRIRGKVGKQYQIVIHRMNYKRELSDARYAQYIKPIRGEMLRFS